MKVYRHFIHIHGGGSLIKGYKAKNVAYMQSIILSNRVGDLNVIENAILGHVYSQIYLPARYGDSSILLKACEREMHRALKLTPRLMSWREYGNAFSLLFSQLENSSNFALRKHLNGLEGVAPRGRGRLCRSVAPL